MKVIIEKIVYPGKSLARSGGKVVLTDEGLPGEEVETAVIKDKKNYIEAATSAVLKPSPLRTKPRCSHYKSCSAYQYIDYKTQIDIKNSQLVEMFSRLGGITDISVKPSPVVWGYRNKIELKIIWENKKPFFAYNLHGAKEDFIKVDQCFLISENVHRLLGAVKEVISADGLDMIKGVVVRTASDEKQVLIALYGDAIKDTARISAGLSGLKDYPGVASIFYIEAKSSRKRLLYGKDFIEEKICGKIFHIGPESFFQINIPMATEMILDLEKSLALSGSGKAADIYCGVGLFGITLADKVREVSGVELSDENVYFLRKNIETNKIKNFTVHKGDCEKLMPQVLEKGVDILILDPPRSGLEKAICDDILKMPAAKIAYASCNPSTLARDLKSLSSLYDIERLFAYDFFPHTPHIETLAILKKKT